MSSPSQRSDSPLTDEQRANALREGAKNVAALRADGHQDLAEGLQNLLDSAAAKTGEPCDF
jgi:hypothetical protein